MISEKVYATKRAIAISAKVMSRIKESPNLLKKVKTLQSLSYNKRQYLIVNNESEKASAFKFLQDLGVHLNKLLYRVNFKCIIIHRGRVELKLSNDYKRYLKVFNIKPINQIIVPDEYSKLPARRNKNKSQILEEELNNALQTEPFGDGTVKIEKSKLFDILKKYI